jgi:hypothetical protein
MKNENSGPANPWIRALACTAIFLLAIWVLTTRYSCSHPPVNDESKEEPKDESKEEPKDESKEEPKDESKEESNDVKEEPASGCDPGKGGASKAEQEAVSGSGDGKASESGGGPRQPESHGTKGAGEIDSEPAGEAVGGLRIEGKTLGVILDTSDSMTPYLPGLRTEIRSRFQNPRFLEVEGCLLEPSSQARGKRPRAAPSGSSERESVMDAIRELIEVHRVDSIYWFSDLEDERTDAALRELASILAPSASRPDGVRLYVRSTGSQVDESLAALVIRSGGSFEVLR